ncbi:MAG TPA: c-type cytochrome [Blastocatellia bacterium]|nr:c-type cytochrome [Blastocatellia bacterium]
MIKKRISHAVIAAAFGVAIVALASSFVAPRPGTVKASTARLQAVAPREKTAGEVFKNIQTLKDLPASELFPTMQFMAASLGVDCAFCHVRPFEKDDKPEKQTARKMIVMMQNINKDNFGGHPAVNCATCHQGHTEPIPFPPLATGEAAPEAREGDKTPLPALDQILDKYVAALGGREAIDKLTTREAQGYIEFPGRPKLNFDIYQKAPDKFFEAESSAGGSASSAFDGSKGWFQEGGGGHVQDLVGGRLIDIRLQSEFFPGVWLKTRYAQTRVLRTETVNGKAAFVVGGRTAAGDEFDRLYFDTETGLLVRVSSLAKAGFGRMPHQIDFGDYKEVDGVKIPFLVKNTTTRGISETHFTQIKHNLTVDDAKFAKPQ